MAVKYYVETFLFCLLKPQESRINTGLVSISQTPAISPVRSWKEREGGGLERRA